MDIKTAAQTIRDTVGMDEVLGLYGYQANRAGFMCCPFHGEREPSMKIYKGKAGWHCFGCGRGGSVIDFVMEHESCDFKTAVIAIDKACGLGLMDPNESPFEADRQKKLQHALDEFVREIYRQCDLMIRKIEWEQVENYKNMIRIENLREEHIDQITVKDWSFLLTYKEDDEYNDYRKEKVEEFKKEVAAWRRAHRKSL